MLDQATRLREIAERHCTRPKHDGPYVMTVASGKGGVGKSTVALNIAIRFAQAGRKTVLVDADDNLGNLDVMLGLCPAMRLGSVIRGDRDLEEVMVTPMPNLAVLPGSSGDPAYPEMTLEDQTLLLNDVKDVNRNADFIVIDAAAGIGKRVLNYALHAHEVLLVTVPEPTAVMDAYALVKMLTAADEHLPVKLIVNAVHLPEEGEETALKLQKAVGHFLHRSIQYIGSIPFDRHVAQAVMRQRPVVKDFPVSAAALSIGVIAERILAHVATRGIRRYQSV